LERKKAQIKHGWERGSEKGDPIAT
jgi:hypothetical protein